MATTILSDNFASSSLRSVSRNLLKMGYNCHFIALPCDRQQRLQIHFLSEEKIELPEKDFQIDETSLAGRVFMKGRYEICDVERTKWAPFWKGRQAKSFIGVPLELDDHVFGVLAVVSEEEINWPADKINKISDLAKTIALAIEQAHFSEALNTMSDKIAPLMLDELNESTFYSDICQTISNLLESERTFIFLLDKSMKGDSTINIRNGVELALKSFNNAGGIFPTYKDFYSCENAMRQKDDNIITRNDLIKIVEISRLSYECSNDKFDPNINLYELLNYAKNNSTKLLIEEDGKVKEDDVGNIQLSQVESLVMKGWSGNIGTNSYYPYVVFKDSNHKITTTSICHEGLTAKVARTGDAILDCCPVDDNLFSASGRHDHFHNNNISCVSFIAVPLKVQNEVIGVLRTENRMKYVEAEKGLEVGSFSGFQKDFVWIISKTLSNVISSYWKKNLHDQNIKETLDIILELLSGYDERILYDKVSELVSSRFNFPKCTIFLIDKHIGAQKLTSLKDIKIFRSIYKDEAEQEVLNSYKAFWEAYSFMPLNDALSFYVLREVGNYRCQSNFKRTYLINAESTMIEWDSITSFVARMGKPLLLHNRKELESFQFWSGNRKSLHTAKRGIYEDKESDQAGKYICNTLVAVPMKHKDETIGVLKIESDDSDHSFTKRDLTTLELMSNAIALAVKNARVRSYRYEELFGIEIFKNIQSVYKPPREIGDSINAKLFINITQFYDKIKGDIPGVVGETEIEEEINKTIVHICKSLGLPRELVNLAGRFKKQEHVLYSMEAYRDHFFHQFHTFLLGYAIINVYSFEQLAVDLKVPTDEHLRWESDFLKTWFLASMFHDVAYPVEKVDGWINGLLKNMMKSKGKFDCIVDINKGLDDHKFDLIHKIESSIIDVLEDNREKVSFGTLRKLFHETKDHAIFSAILLLAECEDTVNPDILLTAAVAIACHNNVWKELKLNFSFAKFPIGFFLSYCDLLQEWSRLPEKGDIKYLDEMQSKRLMNIERSGDNLICSIVYNLDHFSNTLDDNKLKQIIETKINVSGQSIEEKRSMAVKHIICDNISNYVVPATKKWSSTGNSIRFSYKYFWRDNLTSSNMNELTVERPIIF
jgi:transcriptional regulator with GAF, ATPase, and Fis domain